jgi:ubiquinone/menaquinone biosynthesis C-methylase UbiE
MIEVFTSKIQVVPQNFSSEKLHSSVETYLTVYLTQLGLDWKSLKGKEILDIGAGRAKFAQAAKEKGIHVTSVDIAPGGYGGNGKVPNDVPYIIADFKKGLDLPDESFDLIVARASVHSMVKDEKDLETVINEAKRLLKPGGEFRFTPLGSALQPVREDKLDKWFALERKAQRKESLTPQETEWIAEAWNERERQDEKELAGLSPKERLRKIQERSLVALQKIEPTITAYPLAPLSWKHEREQRHGDFIGYYVMKKPLSPSQPANPQ